MINLAKLEEAAKSATPGEWEYLDRRKSESQEGWLLVAYSECSVVTGSIRGDRLASQHQDASYIAQANPSTVLELIECLKISVGALEYYANDPAYKESSHIAISSNFRSDHCATRALAKIREKVIL